MRARTASNPWMELVVDVLATYRLTRLATADVITEGARKAVLRGVGQPVPTEAGAPTAEELVEADPDPPKLATLVTCRWCAGVWIAGGVTAARLLAPGPWSVVARGLALSSGAVLLARLES